eukprot:PhF_6_TR32705/c0_g1_i1/m.48271
MQANLMETAKQRLHEAQLLRHIENFEAPQTFVETPLWQQEVERLKSIPLYVLHHTHTTTDTATPLHVAIADQSDLYVPSWYRLLQVKKGIAQKESLKRQQQQPQHQQPREEIYKPAWMELLGK